MWNATLETVRRCIQRGDIGQVLMARAICTADGLDAAVFALTRLIGPAQRVAALTASDAVADIQLTLDFGASVFAVVTAGAVIRQRRCPTLEVYGSEGTVQWLGDEHRPDGCELWRNAVGAWTLLERPDADIPQALEAPAHAQARHVAEILQTAQASARDGKARALTTSFPFKLAGQG